MKLLFIGCFIEPTLENYLRTVTNNHVVASADTFQKAFLSGFPSHGTSLSYIVNAPAVGSFPQLSSAIRIKGSKFTYSGISGINCGFLNLAFLKRYSIRKNLFKAASKWIEEQESREEIVVILYSLLSPYLEAAVQLKKRYGTKIYCIVADLPEFFSAPNSIIMRALNNYEVKKSRDLTPYIDYFALLTEAMKDKLDVGNRPWIVLEGIYKQEDSLIQIDNDHSKKIILYTGNLDTRFGINKLLNCFEMIDDPKAELVICGSGAAKDYILRKALIDKRIKYMGILNHEEIVKLQHSATVLVNPRTNEGEYTKYSFPSKTMEYMASGVPTLMFKLDGVPKEYDDYVVYFNSTDPQVMKEDITKWINLSSEERAAYGEKARMFILNEKSAEKQVEKFLSLI